MGYECWTLKNEDGAALSAIDEGLVDEASYDDNGALLSTLCDSFD